MGLFDELKKLTQPQDDDSDFFEGADESFKPFIEGKTIIKKIYVRDRLFNIVAK